MNIKHALDRIGGVLYHLAGILFISLTVCMTTQICLRYLANTSLPWMEELNRFLMVWLGFVGAAACSYRGKHVKFGLDIVAKYSVRAARWLFIGILSAFNIFLAFLVMVGITTAIQNMDVFCAALPIRYGWILTVIPVCGSLMLLFHCRDLYNLLRQKEGA
jgi:TRAP-type C4-dicarboxylate transport system permease small subunit